jgi:hypothetical protein
MEPSGESRLAASDAVAVSDLRDRRSEKRRAWRSRLRPRRDAVKAGSVGDADAGSAALS